MHSSLPASSTGSAWLFSQCSSQRWVIFPSPARSWCSSLSINATGCSMPASLAHRQILIRILTMPRDAPSIHLNRFWLAEMNSCESPLTVVGRSIASGGNGNGITTIVVPDAFCPPWVIRLICSINPLKCRRSFSARFKSSGGCRWSILITVPFMAGHICLCPILDHLPPPSANAYCIPKKAHQHRVS